MKAYEDSLYEQWKENVEAILPSLLKRNLLIKPADRAAMLPPEGDGAEKSEAEAGEPSELHLSGYIPWVPMFSVCSEYEKSSDIRTCPTF